MEFGGGVRTKEAIDTIINMGVKRVFLGTAAIQNPALVEWAITTFGPTQIAGDIGGRDGQVTIKGWQETTPLSISEVGRRFRAQGVEWCVLTNVSRDGVSCGVDIASAVKLQNETGLQVVASGGVSSIGEVKAVGKAGLAGVIIGRALYEGKISLKKCLKSLAGKYLSSKFHSSFNLHTGVKLITIVDYKAGNLTSVKRAFDHLGIPNQISSDPQIIKEAERIVFPGVGHAGAAMRVLKRARPGFRFKDSIFTRNTHFRNLYWLPDHPEPFRRRRHTLPGSAARHMHPFPVPGCNP